MFFKDSQTRPTTNDPLACQNQVLHTIRPGDTLYSLANRYNTTVSKILELNPGTEVYNLQIGTGLFICPGATITSPVPPIAPVPPVQPPITPLPPIGTLPTSDAIRELILFILRWIRDNLDQNTAQDIYQSINSNMFT